MTQQDAFINLRNLLAKLYPDEPTAHRVVHDAELNSHRIAFSGAAINNWQAILREAESGNKMDDLFRVVLSEYGTNFELSSACEAYRRASSQMAQQSTSSREAAVMKILFLAANPTDSTRLRLYEESWSIDQALRQAKYRDRFEVRQHWVVRVTDLQSLLLRYQPHIVHFSGHGSDASEIILEDNAGKRHPVSPRALSTVFSLLKGNIRCVVLNACYSQKQAQAIAEHIDCVVGMSTAISDKAAISFASSFYQALGYGRDVRTAFEFGRVQIDLENIPEEQMPQLLAIKADPEQIVLKDTPETPPMDSDKVGRDHIKFGNISDSSVVAIGSHIQQMHMYPGFTADELRQLLPPLLREIEQTAPPEQRKEAVQIVLTLLEEAHRGGQADDSRVAGLLQNLIDLVPGTVSTVVRLSAIFSHSGTFDDVKQVIFSQPRQYFTHIRFPERCHIAVPESLTVQLTQQPVQPKRASLDQPSVRTPRPLVLSPTQEERRSEKVLITVFVSAPGFTADHPWQALMVPLDDDSETIEFELVPKAVGEHLIEVELFHEGNRVGYVVVHTQVVQAERVKYGSK